MNIYGTKKRQVTQKSNSINTSVNPPSLIQTKKVIVPVKPINFRRPLAQGNFFSTMNGFQEKKNQKSGGCGCGG